MKSSISRFPLTRRQTMHRQDGRQEIDRRTLLAKGAAFAALLVTGCARKESRGFAATSLRQLRARLERHIEPGFAPGMVGLVASGPEVETFVLGKMAFEGPDMRRDTIFRIASMTKPVTATAVMMLVEEGKLRLDGRSTGCSLSWPTAECSGGSMQRSTTRCRPGGRLPSRIC
jgi:Beta-lactamase